jgi:hypothetical protein
MGAKALSLMAGDLEHKLKSADSESVASLLADPIWFDGLSRLLQQSLEQMNADFGQSLRENRWADEDSMAPAQWRESLEEVLLLLEAGNLQAIELTDALASKTPQSLRPQFDELVAKVQSLDFSAAMPIGRDLLRSA